MEDLQTELTSEQKEVLASHLCNVAVLKNYLHELEDLAAMDSDLECEMSLAINASHSVKVHLVSLLVR